MLLCVAALPYCRNFKYLLHSKHHISWHIVFLFFLNGASWFVSSRLMMKIYLKGSCATCARVFGCLLEKVWATSKGCSTGIWSLTLVRCVVRDANGIDHPLLSHPLYGLIWVKRVWFNDGGHMSKYIYDLPVSEHRLVWWAQSHDFVGVTTWHWFKKDYNDVDL
jgi:hypothetical protein